MSGSIIYREHGHSDGQFCKAQRSSDRGKVWPTLFLTAEKGLVLAAATSLLTTSHWIIHFFARIKRYQGPEGYGTVLYESTRIVVSWSRIVREDG